MNRKLFRTFFPLLAIVAVQQLVSLGVNLADNIMLGAYSEQALSGAALVNQIQFLLTSIITGIGTGVSVLCSQYWGKGETEPIKRIISLALKFGVAVGLLFALLTAIIPAQILGLLTNDSAVIAEGVTYLRVMCWTYIVFAVANVLMYSLLSVQTAYIGTLMSCSTLIINVCLNYVLIFGHFGFRAMGVTGAAIATLTSRCVELIIVVFYLLAVDKKLKFRLSELLRFELSYLRDFVKVSLPVVLAGSQWGIAQAVRRYRRTLLAKLKRDDFVPAQAGGKWTFSDFASRDFVAANRLLGLRPKTLSTSQKRDR